MALLSLSLFSWLPACSDHALGLRNNQANGRLPDPQIELTPRTLDYGSLTADDQGVRHFTVKNVGPEESILEVSDIRIGGNAAFTLVDPFDDFRLPGGTSKDITVAFTPTVPEANTGDVRVASNDPQNPSETVELDGDGIPPALRITPDPLDLGTVDVGCTVGRDLTLTNLGTFPITVTDASQLGTGFELADPPIPFTIQPHDSETVKVNFSPPDDGNYTGTFSVTSNAQDAETDSTQQGAGLTPPVHRDHFDMPLDPPIDILFFVDQSCSMKDDQTALADNFSQFISNIDRITPDWHIVVATFDDGCSIDGVLTRDVPGYEDMFRTEVSAGGGTWVEAGLTVATHAMENAKSGSCNKGFLRDNALLHVIMVSDEAEQGAGSWDQWLARMRAVKGNDLLLKISSVAGDIPSGCRTAMDSALAGWGYYEATMATGGVFLSLCSSWAEHVNLLADATIAQDAFTLTSPADPNSIVATINGATVNSWRWDAAHNTLIFRTGAGPKEGDAVDISYTEPPICE
jgi:hypothetical protein